MVSLNSPLVTQKVIQQRFYVVNEPKGVSQRRGFVGLIASRWLAAHQRRPVFQLQQTANHITHRAAGGMATYTLLADLFCVSFLCPVIYDLLQRHGRASRPLFFKGLFAQPGAH